MKIHHYLGIATGYLALGAVWMAVTEHVLPATERDATEPPLGYTGQLLFWPWAAGGYVYSALRYGTQGGGQGVPTTAAS